MQYDLYKLNATISHLEPLATEFEDEGGWCTFWEEAEQAEALFADLDKYSGKEAGAVARVRVAASILATALAQLEALPSDDEDEDEDSGGDQEWNAVERFMGFWVGSSHTPGYKDVARILIAGSGRIENGNAWYRVEDGKLIWENVWDQKTVLNAALCLEYIAVRYRSVLAEVKAEAATEAA